MIFRMQATKVNLFCSLRQNKFSSPRLVSACDCDSVILLRIWLSLSRRSRKQDLVISLAGVSEKILSEGQKKMSTKFTSRSLERTLFPGVETWVENERRGVRSLMLFIRSFTIGFHVHTFLFIACVSQMLTQSTRLAIASRLSFQILSKWNIPLCKPTGCVHEAILWVALGWPSIRENREWLTDLLLSFSFAVLIRTWRRSKPVPRYRLKVQYGKNGQEAGPWFSKILGGFCNIFRTMSSRSRSTSGIQQSLSVRKFANGSW